MGLFLFDLVEGFQRQGCCVLVVSLAPEAGLEVERVDVVLVVIQTIQREAPLEVVILCSIVDDPPLL